MGRLRPGKSHGELGVWKAISGFYVGGSRTADSESREAAEMGEGRLHQDGTMGKGRGAGGRGAQEAE